MSPTPKRKSKKKEVHQELQQEETYKDNYQDLDRKPLLKQYDEFIHPTKGKCMIIAIRWRHNEELYYFKSEKHGSDWMTTSGLKMILDKKSTKTQNEIEE